MKKYSLQERIQMADRNLDPHSTEMVSESASSAYSNRINRHLERADEKLQERMLSELIDSADGASIDFQEDLLLGFLFSGFTKAPFADPLPAFAKKRRAEAIAEGARRRRTETGGLRRFGSSGGIRRGRSWVSLPLGVTIPPMRRR